MARWDLPQYQSVYRDLGSVAVNTELRKRYVANFAASDALAGAVGDMDALDFEGDQAAKERLANKYNAELDLMSAQGDYENMGRKTVTLARGFVNDYKPLEKNKASYTAYIASLDAARKAGDLDEIDYTGLKAKARHGYAGLQYDEDGVLDKDSYFAGSGYVKSVDLNALINEQLQNIKPSSWKNLGTDIAVTDLVLTKDGNVSLNQEINANGQIKYWVNTKGGKKYVDPQRVQNIVDGIVYDPNVQLSIDQKTDVMSFDMSPEDAATKAQEILNSYDDKIEEVLASTEYTDDQKEKFVDILEQNQEMLLLKQANEGDLAVVRADLKHDLVANAKAIAVGTYAFSEEEFGRTIRMDDEYLNNIKQNTDNETVSTSVIMNADELPGLGGSSATEKIQSIADFNTSISADLGVLNTAYQTTTGETVTDDALIDMFLNIDNAEQYNELASKFNMSAKKLRNMVSGVLMNRQKRNLIRQKLDEATAEHLGKDGVSYDQVISNEYKTRGSRIGTFHLNGEDLRSALVDSELISKDSSIKDALDYVSSIIHDMNLGQEGFAMDEGFLMSRNDASAKVVTALLESMGYDDLVNDQSYDPTDKIMVEEVSANRSLLDKALYYIVDDYNTRTKKDIEKLDEVFAKTTKKDAWHITYFSPNKTHANTKETRKALSTMFKEGFPPGITFINPDGGADLSLDEYFDESSLFGEWEEDNLEILHENIGLANVSRVDGTPILVIPVKDKTTGKIRNALINATSVKTGGYLESWINSSEYQMHSLFAQGEHAQVKQFKPDIFDNVVFDYNNPTGPSVIINGKLYTKDEGLQMLANTYANRGFANSFEDLYNNL